MWNRLEVFRSAIGKCESATVRKDVASLLPDFKSKMMEAIDRLKWLDLGYDRAVSTLLNLSH
ncbi:MAG: hypothetical protein J7641_04020 [Cyanobacteria bacterium SID2]|nr:hypothetical protein [Cyanobacteria bacterium SID2]MBP0002765.1 hypothetical protein [Cyanobacteria bacterium SBC]